MHIGTHNGCDSAHYKFPAIKNRQDRSPEVTSLAKKLLATYKVTGRGTSLLFSNEAIEKLSMLQETVPQACTYTKWTQRVLKRAQGFGGAYWGHTEEKLEGGK